MKIIIAGDGDTGTHIAGALSVEGQDIVLMGLDKDHLARLDAVCNYITYEGSPMSRANLMECGADSADIFVAVMPDDTINLVACQIAKDCGVKRCVARIDSPDFDSEADRQLFARLGIDLTVYPERLAALDIIRYIEHNWVNEWFDIHGGKLNIIGVRMQSGGSMCGKRLREIPNNPRLFHVVAIKRGESMIIPRGDDMLLEGDTVYFSVMPADSDIIADLCGRSRSDIKHIMITGAGRVTENVLELLPRHYDVTVIDPDRERCAVIASRFPKVVAVNAKANDITALKDEGIARCDIFLALTGSSETNIVSCMVAREHGVRKTVARIEELQYVPEAESLAIDKIINKKLINAGKIFSVLLDCEVSTVQCMSLGLAEITEIVAAPDSKITGRPIADLALPREFTVGGIIRDGNGFLGEGRTVIEAGDHVVIFYVPGALNKVSRYLR
ncbi:MAG: Trk system potassium transporter TrkA [Bacteroidales bacterium]|nr:Trk system potassium transporter TrkA [Bacteroidales bacterium]